MSIPNGLTAQTANLMNQQLSNGAHTHSINAGYGTVINATPKRREPQVFFADRIKNQSSKGFRVPDIDAKLQKLFAVAELKKNEFVFVHSDAAVTVLGDYNPLYAHRPKKLARFLLEAIHLSRFWDIGMLAPCGLVYPVPELVGVRSKRGRTSYAGLALLQHWCEKFPKFKPFYDAYASKKAVEEITVECFDLAMDVRPVSFVELDKKNVDYRIRDEARRYRKMRKDQARIEARMTQDEYNRQMLMHQALLQKQMIGSQQVPRIAMPPVWTSTSAGTAAVTPDSDGNLWPVSSSDGSILGTLIGGAKKIF